MPPRETLLLVFNKIIEKIVYNCLYEFLELHKILFNLQFGFHAKHSINHGIISLTESVKNTLDSEKFGCGIFLNLKSFRHCSSSNPSKRT